MSWNLKGLYKYHLQWQTMHRNTVEEYIALLGWLSGGVFVLGANHYKYMTCL